MKEINETNFEKIEEEVIKKTKDNFKSFYKIYWSGLKTLKNALDLLIEENRQLEKRYVTAVLILVSRSVQHLESMRILTERGLYGDAFVLSRSLIGNTAMIQYLRLKPELIEDFLTETRESYQDKESKFKAKFNEKAIHKVLTDAGVPPFYNSFELLSKTSHPSAFGAQLYGTQGSVKEQYHLKYGPGYESKKVLALFAVMVPGHFDLLNNILIYCCERELTLEWREILIQTNELKNLVEIFSESAIATLNEF